VADEKQQQGGAKAADREQSAKQQQQAQAAQQQEQAQAQEDQATYPAEFVEPNPRPENMGGAPGGESGEGVGPTGDSAPESVQALHDSLAQY